MKFIKSIIQDSIYYGAGNVLFSILNFLCLPIITYYLEPDLYGKYSLVLTFQAVISVFFYFGFNSSFYNFFLKAKSEEEKHEIYIISMQSILIISIILIILILSAKDFISRMIFDTSGFSFIIVISALIIFADTLYGMYLQYLWAIRKAKLYFRFSLGKNLFQWTAIILALIISDGNLSAIFIAVLVQYILIVSFITYYLRAKYNIGLIRNIELFKSTLFRRMLSFAYPFILTSLFTTFLNYIDRYMIQVITGSSADVGIYSMGYKIGIGVSMITLAFRQGAIPYLYKARNEGHGPEAISKAFNLFYFGGLFAVLAFSIFSDEIFLLLDPAYKNGAPVVLYSSLSAFFWGCYSIFSIGLYFNDKSRLISIIIILSAAANIGFNAILIPVYSIKGAAVASAASFILLALISLYASGKYYFVKYNLGKFALTLAIAMSLYYFSQNLFVATYPNIILVKTLLLSVYLLLAFLIFPYKQIKSFIHKAQNSIFGK